MKNKPQNAPNIKDSPNLIPVMGLLSGLAIWIIDAYIDVIILNGKQTLLENIFNPEATELWLRTLIVFVLLAMGIFSRRSTLKHIALDQRLLNYQQELEQQVAQRTEELTEKTQQLQIVANQDPLTQLSNRRKFNESLAHEFLRFQRHRKPFSIIMIDIDHFKSINDKFGHDTGDKVLVRFAEVLSEYCRCTDTVARWGGEEFIALSIETDLNQALLQAKKIIQAIRSTDFPAVGKITASLGVCCNLHHDTAESIINHADKALHKAKHNGRDRIEH